MAVVHPNVPSSSSSSPSGDIETTSVAPTIDSENYQFVDDIGTMNSERNQNTVLILLFLIATLILGVGAIPALKNQQDEERNRNSREDKYYYPPSSSGPICLHKKINETFHKRLPLFSENITTEGGYSSLNDFKEDLKEVGKYFLNAAMDCEDFIYRNDAPPDSPQDSTSEGDVAKKDENTTLLDADDESEIYHQESAIHRADLVLSDGNFIFACYSDHLVVFGTLSQGVVFKTKLRPIHVPVVEGRDTSPTAAVMARSFPQPETNLLAPRIQALLLHRNRLTDIISGYGVEYAAKLEVLRPSTNI